MNNFKNKQLGLLVILSLFFNLSTINANPLEDLITSISAKATELKDWAVANPKKAAGAGVGTAAALIGATAGALYLNGKNKEEDENKKVEDKISDYSEEFAEAQSKIEEQSDETKKAAVVEKKDDSLPLAKFTNLNREEAILVNGFLGNVIGKNSAHLQMDECLKFDQTITDLQKEDISLILKGENTYLSLKSSLLPFFENQDLEIDKYLEKLKSIASQEVAHNSKDVVSKLNQFAVTLKTQNIDLDLSQAIAKAKEIIIEQSKINSSQKATVENVFLKIKSIIFGKTIDRQKVAMIAGQILGALLGEQFIPEELFEKIENGASIKASLMSK